YVPNALFTTVVVENPSRMTHRRLHEKIAIRYADLPRMAAIVEDIRAMLLAHEGIDSTQTLIVAFNKYDVSGLEIYIYCFANTVVWVRFHEIKHDVLLRIGEIITKHGAEVALPTRTVHMPRTPAWSGEAGAPDDACMPDAGPAGRAAPGAAGEVAHGRQLAHRAERGHRDRPGRQALAESSDAGGGRGPARAVARGQGPGRRREPRPRTAREAAPSPARAASGPSPRRELPAPREP